MHTIYEPDTGRIIGHLTCPDHLFDLNENNMPDGHALIRDGGDVDGNDFYVGNDEQIIPRPLMACEPNKISLVADGVDEIVIPGLPIPCTMIVSGKKYKVTDGSFELSIDQPGIYAITAEAFPYVSREWEVTAT